ncbi:hypothetical protein NDU88_002009 [Pleurodeles waltl]|uniref:Uncharacterized protein n=1 Tax=Pleurodeles waltl TaxID=8319 RepID=A0AAV7T137_PLEWA|nr:hypothetical protein NDU88_002009 [Pleurodeles waltl]
MSQIASGDRGDVEQDKEPSQQQVAPGEVPETGTTRMRETVLTRSRTKESHVAGEQLRRSCNAGYLWNKGTKSKSHKQVGDGQMPRKCQLRVQRSFDWTEEAEVSAGTKRARDFPFGGRIPLALESRAEVFSRRKDANKPC